MPAQKKICQRSKISRPCSELPRGMPNDEEHDAAETTIAAAAAAAGGARGIGSVIAPPPPMGWARPPGLPPSRQAARRGSRRTPRSFRRKTTRGGRETGWAPRSRRSRQTHQVIVPTITGTTKASTLSTSFRLSTSTCRYLASTSFDPASISSTKSAIPPPRRRCAGARRAALRVVVQRGVASHACLEERPDPEDGEDDAGDHDGRQEQLADRVPEEVELPVRPEPQDALQPSRVEIGLRRRRSGVSDERS